LVMPRPKSCGSSAAISSVLLPHLHRLRAEQRRYPTDERGWETERCRMA
jgi:hypothetical protein